MRIVKLGKRVYDVFPTIYQGRHEYRVRLVDGMGSVGVTLLHGQGYTCDHCTGCKNCLHIKAVQQTRKELHAEREQRLEGRRTG